MATEVLAGAEHSGHVSDSLSALEALGTIELLRGNPSASHAHLGRAWKIVRAAGATEPNKAPFLPDEIEALIQLGRLDEARWLIQWLDARGRSVDRARAIATAARCDGLLLAAKGDVEAALASLERAAREHERLDDPFEFARTLLALGAVRRRARQKRRAREPLDHALSIFQQLGALPWIERSRAELASIGGRPPATGDLTPTERRVARLAAAGRTNREIAEELFISVRTVAGHLSHAYQKLGIRSRTELAAVEGNESRDGEPKSPMGNVAHF